MKFSFWPFIHVLMALLVAGCAVSQINPALADKAKLIKTVALLPPRIEVYETSAGKVTEKKDNESIQARSNIVAAIKTELQGKTGIVVKAIAEDSLPEDAKSNLKETYALFDEVRSTITLLTTSTSLGGITYYNIKKLKNFDYSLGEEIKGLKMGEADVFLLVSGTDLWSLGGQRSNASGWPLIFAPGGFGLGAGIGLLASSAVAGASSASTEVAAALVDAQSGSILWYKSTVSGPLQNLRDPESSAALVKKLLKEFPLGESNR